MPFGQHIVSIAMMNDAFLQQSNRSDVCICHSYLDVSKVADNIVAQLLGITHLCTACQLCPLRTW